MADTKKDGDGYDGYDALGGVIGFIIIIFVIATLVGRYGFGFSGTSFIKDSFVGDTAAEQNKIEDKGGFSLSSYFSSGDIFLGELIINNKDVDVHRSPAGRILGQQSKREVGKVLEGPAEAQNMAWWRIDYENAPDGWVNQSDITGKIWRYRFLNIFPIIFGTITPFLILLSIIIFVLIFVVLFKMKTLDKLKQKKLDHSRGKNTKEEIEETIEKEKDGLEEGDEHDSFINNLPTGNESPKTKDVHNRRWSKVESLINSHNVNDWKQAIIEADIILDEMLDKMGYKGDTIAEKLKQVEESDFLTLNQAWEAHKIRNKIAHKAEYVLTKSDADRAIGLFKQVFQEFYFI
jgi:uncharacterized membrane protein